jgi:hypothetical protein
LAVPVLYLAILTQKATTAPLQFPAKKFLLLGVRSSAEHVTRPEGQDKQTDEGERQANLRSP